MDETLIQECESIIQDLESLKQRVTKDLPGGIWVSRLMADLHGLRLAAQVLPQLKQDQSFELDRVEYMNSIRLRLEMFSFAHQQELLNSFSMNWPSRTASERGAWMFTE